MTTLDYFNKVIVKYIKQNIHYILYLDESTNTLTVSSNILQVDLFLGYLYIQYGFINSAQLIKLIQNESNLYLEYKDFLEQLQEFE